MKISQLFAKISNQLLFLMVLVLIVSNIFAYSYIFYHKITLENISTHNSVSVTIANSVPHARPLFDTLGSIHTFLAFDYAIPNPVVTANRYDAVWGTEQSHIQAFRTGNPSIFLSYYIPFNRDEAPQHDLAYWKTFHPDWILYRCDRVTPAYEFGDPNIPLNFTNSAVISWQVQTYALSASRSGYDAIAADNVDLENEFGACGSYINGKWVQLFTGQHHDPHWRNAIIGWLSQMQKSLHLLPHPLALIPNLAFDTDQQPNSHVMQQVVSHLDGLLDEEGVTHFGKGYLTGTAWLQRIQFMEQIQGQHKPYYIIDQFPLVGSDEIEWGLASYLMGKEHEAALYISTIQGYGSDSWYNEYNAQIGVPLNAMYRKQNIYWRDYSHGLSLVNPNATASYTITLNTKHHYMDLYSHLVGPTIQMPPHSGMVLLLTSLVGSG